MHINKDNDADICHFAAMLEAAETRGHTRGYEQGLKDAPTQLDDAKRAAEKVGYDKGYEAARAHALNFIHDGTGPRGTIDLAYHLKNRDERMRESWRTNELPKAVEGVRKLGFDQGYAKGKADAIKGFPEHLPAIDPESRKKLNATINEAAEFIRQEAYEKGHGEGHQKGWEAGYKSGMGGAALALAREAGDGYGDEIEMAIKARDNRMREAAIREVEEAWSWWVGATVEGRKKAETTGRGVKFNAIYYLAQATNWAINYNTGEQLENPISRATVLQEGRKTGHEAAIEFAKQVIAGTLRDDSYGLKEAVDTRVRLAEIRARNEARDEAFVGAGLMAQAALKSGNFSRYDNEGKELAEALDGFLERERDYRRRNSRDVATQECWDAFAKLAEQVAAGEPFDRPNKPNVISVPSAERRRVEEALTKLQARWSRAASLVSSYIHDGGLKPTTGVEMEFVALLRELRRNSYLDGFDCARKKAIREAHDLKAPNVVDIPDPVSDVPF